MYIFIVNTLQHLFLLKYFSVTHEDVNLTKAIEHIFSEV